jgi:hypothetical protein
MRILGLPVTPHFKVQRRPGLAARVSNMCDHITGGNLLADLMQEILIVSVETEPASAMIDHQQLAETRQPVCIGNPAITHGNDIAASWR